MNSAPLIAFDQHAATTVAAVLVPGQRTPALHSLTSETPTMLRFVKRLRAQTWPLPALEQTHRAYRRAVDEVVAQRHDVEHDLRALLDLEPLRERVQRLRCFRGIDALTALTIAAELGDARRCGTAPSTMAYVGLVPSEHSSGTTRAQRGITKTGNAHVRRVRVESAWHYRHHPFVGDTGLVGAALTQ